MTNNVWKTATIILAVVIFGALGFYTYNQIVSEDPEEMHSSSEQPEEMTEELHAKQTVDNYLEAVKSGNGDPSQFSQAGREFINLLSYQFYKAEEHDLDPNDVTYRFVYKVNITNGLGQSIHKQYIFFVKPTSRGSVEQRMMISSYWDYNTYKNIVP